MQYMHNVLDLTKIPNDTGVAIEYRIPQSSKRIDFILTGKDQYQRDMAIIVELKQWSKVSRTEKDAVVRTYLQRGQCEVEHPSYQAWTYSALLYDFNETVRKEKIQLRSCAYLHNCVSNDVINHSFYNEHTSRAPSFLKQDTRKLSDFIRSFIKYGDADKIMYRIENGKISPSKNLADQLVSLLNGSREFLMIDDQKVVYETVLFLAKQSEENSKHVLIVNGGPGTGKSVIAVNLLVELTRRKMVVQYVTKNAAPRAVYESKLTGSFKKSHISNMFKSSGAYTSCDENVFDVLVVDEAHRLNEKSGFFQNQGENQIQEIIQASKFSVFFIDEKQQVTFKDIGDREEIVSRANRLGVKVQEMELTSQFRCNGSDGYLAWVDNALQIEETPVDSLESFNYDFRVLDSPNDLRDLIYRKNQYNNKARIVAGYCWDWITKKNSGPGQYDIKIDEHNFMMKWNLADDGNLWILKPESVSEAGCIHTCQGLELDYIGVIIGPDLICRDGKLITVPEKRARTDASLKGYKKLLKENPELAARRAERIIKNTYRTLLTRGQKGCYVFCTDPETNEYFKSLLPQGKAVFHEPAEAVWGNKAAEDSPSWGKYPGLPLKVAAKSDVIPFVNAVPVFDFSNSFPPVELTAADESYDWVWLPEYITCGPDFFVVRMVGESMNKRIADGAWCLFKKTMAEKCAGEIVLAYHPDIYNTDGSGCYAIRRYWPDESVLREQRKVLLQPETRTPGYADIEIAGDSIGRLEILGEFVLSF
ncbi:hypothetical protein HNR65_003574 [Desulfosalsimonas propionicica]|uniref:HTH cro/C1-type domain-containing protein n=1 Tax=Desulfosalsimonas propionicica TaxID=332175 RepID=A0A7W0CCN5_9BACT|nr:DUF2075 domain-containing protein [Desulfosalsimonas propionicica]MBA2883212.1 hypothetical protein [Desulfosalsimonas propionicica]